MSGELVDPEHDLYETVFQHDDGSTSVTVTVGPLSPEQRDEVKRMVERHGLES